MKKPTSKYCRNCHYPLSPSAKFCSQCSQKYTTGKISVGSLIQEFLEDHLNFDSKLIKTAIALIVPGKLTDEYFKGRHKRFASPIRLFLVSAILLIATLNIDFSDPSLVNPDFPNYKKEAAQKDYLRVIDSLQNEVKIQFNDPIVNRAFDSLQQNLPHLSTLDDTLRIDQVIKLSDFSFKIPDIAKLDLVNKKPNEIVALYGKDLTFFPQLLFTQALKVFLSGNTLLKYVFDKLTWTILLMMPFLAMILKILYIRRQHFYVEHLIFSFHYHSFLFLLLSLFILSNSFLSEPLIVGLIFYIFAHLYLSMKKVYKQGKRKTFFKFLILNFSYVFLAAIFGVLTIIISFFLF